MKTEEGMWITVEGRRKNIQKSEVVHGTVNLNEFEELTEPVSLWVGNTHPSTHHEVMKTS